MSANPPQLRPMSVGDILDQAIRIYRRNFVPLVIIVAIVSLPYVALQLAITLLTNPFTLGFSQTSQSFDPDAINTGTLLAGQLLSLGLALAYGVALVFQSGALTAFVSEKFLGRAISVREAYGRAFRRWLALLIAVVLLSIIFGVVLSAMCGLWLVPLMGISALGAGLDSGSSAAFGVVTLMLCCLVGPALAVAIFLGVRWSFFVQAIVLEDYNSSGGLGRSWKLVKGSFWRAFFVIAALALLVFVLNLGLYLLALTLAALTQSPIALVILSSVSMQLINIIFTPLQFAALTILYYDLRIRKEGFDLQMQMQQLPQAAPLPMSAPPEPQVPPAPPATNAPSLDLPPLYSRDDYPPRQDAS